MTKHIIYKGEGGRLDAVVSSLLGITRSQAQKKIKTALVLVNSQKAKPNKIVVQGDKIIVKEEIPQKEAEKPAIDIIYEDENIIVLNKQPGIVVYPDESHKSGTLLDAIKDKMQVSDEERPGVVHRLDKDTSGLIVFAKNSKSEQELKKLIKDRKFEKTYLTLVWGKIQPEKGSIDIPIKRSEKDRKKMEASVSGREALTKYELIKYIANMSYLKVRIITGRTHQIRVHFAGIGYPVVRDKAYGKKGDSLGLLKRQFLHAHELAFELFGKKYHFKSDLPEDLEKIL